ncbi:hypothetical protein DMH18_21720 [Streptomyces sp. WAC 06783]|nr:hypothetical protein FMM49_18180 [Streptomyces rimosus subsp. rimosus]RSO08131.1 hypothetical protein DMH18_21720 [Streptomyces sp. WAC 06783]
MFQQLRGVRPRHSSSLTFGTWARGCTLRRTEQRCGRIVGSGTRSKQGASKGIRRSRPRSFEERAEIGQRSGEEAAKIENPVAADAFAAIRLDE